MIGLSLGVLTADEVGRLVRALGGHRYVAGRQLLVHALALEHVGGEAQRWAREVLADPDVDAASRDERLVRACSEAELALVLALYWGDGPATKAAHDGLRASLARLELPLPDPAPFDESREDEVFPLLVDAGWELLSLAELDPERHRGAIAAYGEPILYESARFEEEEAMPKQTHLYELPALGPRELLEAAENGALRESLVLYTEGEPTYLDYVTRGVLKAAKLA